MAGGGSGNQGAGGGPGGTGPGCGHDVRPGARFCTVCGRPAVQDSQAAAPAWSSDPAGWPDAAPAGPSAKPGWQDTTRWPDPAAAGAGGQDQAAAEPGWPDPAVASPGWQDPAAAGPGWPDQAAAEPGWQDPAAASHGWPDAAPAGSGWPDPVPVRGEPAEGSPRRSRPAWLLALAGGLLVVAAAAAAVILLVRPFHHGHPAAAGAGSGSSTSRPLSDASSTPASPQSGSSASAAQQGAQNLAALLSQSVADRASVVQAVSDVSHCGPHLSQDAQTFASAASSRQALLSRLASLPDSSALPAPMLQSLAGAWQASVQADQDFAQWAHDELSQGCTPDDQSDPGYQAAAGPDAQATTDKKAFASQWDPIATQYGLTAYQWDQI